LFSKESTFPIGQEVHAFTDSAHVKQLELQF